MLKQGLFPVALKVAFSLCTESSSEDSEEGNEDDEEDEEDGMYLSMRSFGCQMIDQFAVGMSSDKIWEPCMQYVQHYALSNQPAERRAALDVLTV